MSIQPVSGEIKAQPLNDNFSYLDSQIMNINAGPIGTFDSVSALNSKYPSGANGPAVVLESDGKTGYTYIWTGTKWEKGALYQERGISDSSIELVKLSDAVLGKNKFSGNFVRGMGILGGTNSGTYSAREGGVCAIVKVNPSTIYAVSKSASNLFRVGACQEYPEIGTKITHYDVVDEAYPGRNTWGFGTNANENYLVIYLANDSIAPVQLQVELGGTVTEYEEPGAKLPINSATVGLLEKKRVDATFIERPQAELYADAATFEVDLTAQKIKTVNNGSNFILVDNQRYQFEASTWDYSEVSSNTVFVYFDKDTKGFVFAGHSDITDSKYNDLALVGFIRKPDRTAKFNGFYTLTGANQTGETPNFYLVGNVNDDYVAEHDEYTNAITSSYDVSQILGGYDDLVAADPDYIKKSKIGTSAGGKPIYRYDLKPPQAASYVKAKRAVPKIVLSGTLHGHEKQASRGLLIFIRNLVKNWKSSEALKFIRTNLHIVLIPMINPDGYETAAGNTPDGSGPAGRKNANKVDINRNFGPYWGEAGSGDINNWQYRGPAELSEPEAQMLDNLMKNEPDVLHFIDYHNYGDFKVFKDIFYVSTNVEAHQPLWLAHAQYQDAKLRKDFPSVDIYKDSPLAAVRSHFPNSWQFYAEYYGSNSILVETVESAAGVSNEEMYLINADVIGNVVLTLLKNIATYI